MISICIPNYNNAKYLDKCIQSALNQTYKDIEIILVDDFSTDNSLEIANKYSDKIKILQNNENLGQPKNTKKAISYSKGSYIVILHSDDYLLPSFAERLVPILDEHPNVGMAFGERMETDESGIPTRIAPFYNTNCIIPSEKQAKVFMMSAVIPCQVLFRYKTYILSGGIDERYTSNLDGLLWFKCAMRGDVGYIQNPVSVYRRHNKNATSTTNQSIDFILEHYLTLKEMFRLAKGNTYLENHFNNALRKLASLTLRYCYNAYKLKNLDLVKQYLNLAIVFDPDVINNCEYKLLKHGIESNESLLYNKCISIRTSSYEPPEGFIPL